jgi:glycine/D-amino acid oxidase-like deaminating enzyme
MTRAAHVAIVGGGIVGVATAYYLARDGVVRDGGQITVVERDSVGSHASGFAFGGLIGMIEASGPHGAPPTLGTLALRLHRELASVLPAETGVDTAFRVKPSVMLAMTSGEVPGLRRSFEYLRDSGVAGEVRWLDSRAEIDKVEPRVAPGVATALYADISAEVEPYRLTLALAQAAEGRGARIRHGAVSGLSLAGGRVNGIMIGDEVVEADFVVIAAGPWTQEATKWTGARLPIHPLKGQILRLRAPGQPLNAMFWWGNDYATTKPDGLVWAGTTEEHAGFDDTPTPEARDQIMASAISAFPYLEDARLVRQTACLRPVSSDGDPVIGFLPKAASVVIATGAGRNGIMLGPALGRLAADLVLGKTPSCEIRGLGPGRFGRPA